MKKTFTCGLLIAAAALTLTGCQGKEIREDVIPGGKLPAPDKNTKVDHLIFQEIFYAGMSTSYNNAKYSYDYDSYIRIVNPTNEEKYLDGLVLAISTFSSNTDWRMSETRKLMEDHFCTSKIVQFPGTGKQYPIKPGQSVLITASAFNHQQKTDDFIGNNPNSFDLSNADFEWMTPEQTKTEWDMTDNPKVPNMLSIVSENDYLNPNSASFMQVTVKASAIALIKLQTTTDSLRENKYRHHYVAMEGNGHSHQMASGYCVAIPQEWVIDAVSICPEEEFKTYNIPTSLDKGYRGVQKRSNEEISLYAGKAIFRKDDGRNYLDTNDSRIDFEVRPASMGPKK